MVDVCLDVRRGKWLPVSSPSRAKLPCVLRYAYVNGAEFGQNTMLHHGVPKINSGKGGRA